MDGCRRVGAADLVGECAHESRLIVAHDRIGGVDVIGQQSRHRIVCGRHLIDALQALQLEDDCLGGREFVARDIGVDRLDAECEIGLMRGKKIGCLSSSSGRTRKRDHARLDLLRERRRRKRQSDLRGEPGRVIGRLRLSIGAGHARGNRRTDQRRPFGGIPIAARRQINRRGERRLGLGGGERAEQRCVVEREIGELAQELQLGLGRRAKRLADIRPEARPIVGMGDKQRGELLRLPGAAERRHDEVVEGGHPNFGRHGENGGGAERLEGLKRLRDRRRERSRNNVLFARQRPDGGDGRRTHLKKGRGIRRARRRGTRHSRIRAAGSEP